MRFLFAFLFCCSIAFAQKPTLYFGKTIDTYQNSIAYGNNSKAGKYADVGDTKIYYETYGKGTPMVVLHGGVVGSIAEMGRFIDSLASHHKVIAIATRGHGKSGVGTAVPSYQQKAQDLNKVLSQENADKVSIIGFSDGAYTGIYFANLFPQKIEKLVAIGAGEWQKGFRQFTGSLQIFENIDPAFWAEQQQLRPEPKKTAQWIDEIYKYYQENSVPLSVFQNVQCPTLMLAGEKDENAPLNTMISAYKVMPNAQLGIIPNAPHPVFVADFNAVWASISPFLQLQQSKNKSASTETNEVKSEILVQTSKSWDGTNLPKYLKGQPELIIKRFVFPPKTILSKHYHKIMSCGVVLKGALTLVANNGNEKTFHTGEAFVETVGTIHHGENRGETPLEVIVFYAGNKGIPLSFEQK